MEDIIGGWSDDSRFASFLENWQAILDRRVERVRQDLGSIDGLTGAVLAGSLGRGAPWPLSDIDLILIAEAGREDEVRGAIDDIRARRVPGWIAEGWWTGIDAGRLLFSDREVDRTCDGAVSAVDVIEDPRWFHTMDKAFGGRPLLDGSNQPAGRLAAWATRNRFEAVVVDRRLRHHETAARRAVAGGRDAAMSGNLLAGTLALWRAVQLVQVGLMATWGQRDNSLGRFGSRFAEEARQHEASDLVDRLDALAGLDAPTLEKRWAVAPDWVLLRHDRSVRSRRAAGEDVSDDADRRDTLRVSARYAANGVTGANMPAWLGIAGDVPDLTRRLSGLDAVLNSCQTRPD